MGIRLDGGSNLPSYLQIRNQLREQILRGDLAPGTRLTPERKMAQVLGVSRTTVVAAYDELLAEGLVEARVGHGTVVMGRGAGREGMTTQSIAWSACFSQIGQRLQESATWEALELRRLCCRSDITSLAMGSPDSDLIPIQQFNQAWETVLSREGPEAFDYGRVEGLDSLRELIAARMRRQQISTRTEDVMIINGSTQGLDFLLRLLTEPGDTVIAEVPTYFGSLQAFQAQGVRVIGVPVDQSGMQVERVEFLLARYRPRLIYTNPTFQNPTGTTMSLERRERLLTLAQRYQVPIVEDDPFSALSFDEPPPPAIKSLDHDGHVLYLGTFSKCLSPGVRVGWLVAPPPVIELAGMFRRVADMQPNTLTQYLVAEFIERGWLDEHVGKVRHIYAARSRAMDEALRRHMPSGARWHNPAGGMFLWLELPERVTDQDLLSEAIQRGVVFLPGHLMYPARGRRHAARLNFSVPDEETIGRGVAVLAASLKQLLKHREEEPKQTAPSSIV
jgi:DNA-binding transcriptional MocR family regulator